MLNRDPDDISASSRNFSYYERLTAQASGSPAASALEVYQSYPEAGPQAILDSPEFQGAHPNLSDSDFVNLIFRQALRRAPSSAETSYFAQARLSRAEVANRIINYPEGIASYGYYGHAAYGGL